MKLFRVVREEDVSGVSGTGHVADAVEFDNGWVAISWRTDVNSVGIYRSMEDAERIHGHDGRTRFDEIISVGSVNRLARN